MRLHTIIDLHEQANPTMEKFWETVKNARWTSDHNYDRIKYQWMRKLTPSQAEGLRRRFDEVKAKLDRKITNVTSGVGDDGYSDLLSHIIGMGKEAYDEVMADPSLAQGIIDRDEYVESFLYSFPYEDDWLSVDPKHLIDQATKYLEGLEQLTGSRSPIKSQESAEALKDMIKRLRIAVSGDFKKAVRGWNKEEYNRWGRLTRETEEYEGIYGPPNLINDLVSFITH